MSEAEKRLFNITANSERSYKMNAQGGVNAFIQKKKKRGDINSFKREGCRSQRHLLGLDYTLASCRMSKSSPHGHL